MVISSGMLGSNQFLPWTEQELQLVRDEYVTKGPTQCAQKIGRSPRAIAFQAAKMGLKKQPAWSEADLLYLRKHYGDMSQKEIANELGKTATSVAQMAMKMGVNGVNYKEWLPEEIASLKNDYSHKDFIGLCASLPKHSKGSIKGIAKKLRLRRRTKGLDLILANLEPLTTETYEALYWLGFLLADGHFSAQNRLQLTLAIKDEAHLEKFASFINFTGTKQKDTKKVSIAIMDQWWVGLLKKKYDLDHQKTYRPPSLDKFSHLSDDQWLSLVIGFIDGDGSIITRKHTKTCNLTIKNHASWLPFLNLISTRLEYTSGIPLKRAKINSYGYALLGFSNHPLNKHLKNAAQRLNLPVLERKWSRIDENYVNPYEITALRRKAQLP